jgi:RNA polymerase sigma factor (sigma-70 family)
MTFASAPPDATLSPSESMEETSDHDLMLAVRAGELGRLGDLFERHHRQLYGFLARLIGNREAAEDLVQIVFQRTLKYRHTYRDEGKFSAWLYHIARRVAADHYRRSARQPTPTDPADFDRVSDEITASAGESAAKRDDLAIMQTALEELPLEQREILVLHRFQHLSHQQIAKLLNISTGAAKVRVHRALAALRDRFFKLSHRPASQA